MDGLQSFDVGNPAEPVFVGEVRNSRFGALYASDV